MSSQLYDRMRWIALVLLPALGALYATLSIVLSLPAGAEVAGTIAAIDTFLGLLLRQSSKNYQRLVEDPKIMGDLIVTTDVDGTPIKARLEGYDAVPVFEEDRLAAYRVKREPLT